MKRKTMYVKSEKGGWLVTNNHNYGKVISIYTKTSSKTDAIRYARACQQRTGVHVEIVSDLHEVKIKGG